MIRTVVTKRLEIDAGHRLLRHEGKCRNLHGHRYAFEVSVEADGLDSVGRVVDFSVVKAKVGGWLDEHWDHGFLLQADDPLVPVLTGDAGFGPDSKHFIVDCPPTAENLSRLVYERAVELLEEHGVRVVAVRCYETPTCWADYQPPEAAQ